MEKKENKGAWKPGQSGNPAGRQKGKGNHVTTEVRERFKEIVESQMDNVTEALDRIACEDPAKYVDMLTKLSAFFTPKLTEDVGKQSPPVFILPAGAKLEENKQEQSNIEEDDEE
jgi:hypothetical protein